MEEAEKRILNRYNRNYAYWGARPLTHAQLIKHIEENYGDGAWEKSLLTEKKHMFAEKLQKQNRED